MGGHFGLLEEAEELCSVNGNLCAHGIDRWGSSPIPWASFYRLILKVNGIFWESGKIALAATATPALCQKSLEQYCKVWQD